MKSLKVLLPLFFFSIISLACFAQSANALHQEPVVAKFTSLFNTQKFDSIYGMLNKITQQKMAQATFTGFLSTGLFSTYGAIKTVTYIIEKPPLVQYTVQFEKGLLDIALVTDSSN